MTHFYHHISSHPVWTASLKHNHILLSHSWKTSWHCCVYIRFFSGSAASFSRACKLKIQAAMFLIAARALPVINWALSSCSAALQEGISEAHNLIHDIPWEAIYGVRKVRAGPVSSRFEVCADSKWMPYDTKSIPCPQVWPF